AGWIARPDAVGVVTLVVQIIRKLTRLRLIISDLARPADKCFAAVVRPPDFATVRVDRRVDNRGILPAVGELDAAGPWISGLDLDPTAADALFVGIDDQPASSRGDQLSDVRRMTFHIDELAFICPRPFLVWRV